MLGNFKRDNFKDTFTDTRVSLYFALIPYKNAAK